ALGGGGAGGCRGRLRGGAARAGRGEPGLRGALRLHFHRVRHREDRGRDAGPAPRAPAQRPAGRDPGRRRRAGEDHPDPAGEAPGRMSPITTHVLDTARGRPAAGVPVLLELRSGAETWTERGRGTTDADGRIKDLVTGPLVPGVYRLTFDTAVSFRALTV